MGLGRLPLKCPLLKCPGSLLHMAPQVGSCRSFSTCTWAEVACQSPVGHRTGCLVHCKLVCGRVDVDYHHINHLAFECG